MGYVEETRILPSGIQCQLLNSSTGVSEDMDVQYLPLYHPSTEKLHQSTSGFRSDSVASILGLEDTGDNSVFSAMDSQDVQRLLRNEQSQQAQSQADTGHPFQTTKRSMYFSHPNHSFHLLGDNYYGRGPLIPTGSYSELWTENPGVDIDPAFYGPAAVQATIPTKSIADIAVSLAELKREGFPRIKDPLDLNRSFGSAQNAAQNHLSTQFGFAPIVSEVRRLANAVIDYHKIIKAWVDNSARPIRASYSFQPVSSAIDYNLGTGSLALQYYWGPNGTLDDVLVGGNRYGNLYGLLERRSEVYFKGQYIYHLPEADRLLGESARFLSEANRLLGFRLTPEVLYNLAPWSWLSDWFTNVGTNISNATALQNDGLVMSYGYLMVKQQTTFTHSLYGPRFHDGTYGPYSVSYVTTRKRRIKATPYGFGLDPASFSARQWSILGALGLTLAPERLR